MIFRIKKYRKKGSFWLLKNKWKTFTRSEIIWQKVDDNMIVLYLRDMFCMAQNLSGFRVEGVCLEARFWMH